MNPRARYRRGRNDREHWVEVDGERLPIQVRASSGGGYVGIVEWRGERLEGWPNCARREQAARETVWRLNELLDREVADGR